MEREIKPNNTNNVTPFEVIRKTNEYGNDYWSSRELGQVLKYSEYRKDRKSTRLNSSH